MSVNHTRITKHLSWSENLKLIVVFLKYSQLFSIFDGCQNFILHESWISLSRVYNGISAEFSSFLEL